MSTNSIVRMLRDHHTDVVVRAGHVIARESIHYPDGRAVEVHTDLTGWDAREIKAWLGY
jgi:hypothetical protein